MSLLPASGHGLGTAVGQRLGRRPGRGAVEEDTLEYTRQLSSVPPVPDHEAPLRVRAAGSLPPPRVLSLWPTLT